MMNHNKQLFSFFVNCPMLLQDHLDELNGQRWSNSINTWANLTETTCLVTNLNFLVEILSITKTNCRVRRQCSFRLILLHLHHLKHGTAHRTEVHMWSILFGVIRPGAIACRPEATTTTTKKNNNNNNDNNDDNNNNNNNNNHDSDFSDPHVTGIVVGIFGSEDVYFFSTIIDPNEHELQKVWGHSW